VGGGLCAAGLVVLSLSPVLSAAAGVAGFSAVMAASKPKKAPQQDVLLLNAGIDERELRALILKNDRMITDMRRHVYAPGDKEIAEKISTVTDTARKIVRAIKEKPSRLPKARMFLNYYLPATERLIARYGEILKRNLTDADSVEFMSKASDTLTATEQGFTQLLSSLYKDDLTDSSLDMIVMRQMMEGQGLLPGLSPGDILNDLQQNGALRDEAPQDGASQDGAPQSGKAPEKEPGGGITLTLSDDE